ncbi:MAG: hypothetical protein ONB16_11320, partial [candidate division KSB1 bacterium]|nr:hypothetical protein [candidate division KSB1 bacterium]
MRFKYLLPALTITLVMLISAASLVWSADSQKKQFAVAKSDKSAVGPIVLDNWKYHKIGTLWNRVTNFGYAGDDAYVDRTPSCDYPGGSGNSYLYRGSLWLTAEVNGVIHSSQADDHEFAPIDSVVVITGAG